MFFVARMLFRGIYFPQMTGSAWLRLLAANGTTIARLVARQLFVRRTHRPRPDAERASALAVAPSVEEGTAAGS
jgi:hypothetical protein